MGMFGLENAWTALVGVRCVWSSASYTRFTQKEGFSLRERNLYRWNHPVRRRKTCTCLRLPSERPLWMTQSSEWWYIKWNFMSRNAWSRSWYALPQPNDSLGILKTSDSRRRLSSVLMAKVNEFGVEYLPRSNRPQFFPQILDTMRFIALPYSYSVINLPSVCCL